MKILALLRKIQDLYEKYENIEFSQGKSRVILNINPFPSLHCPTHSTLLAGLFFAKRFLLEDLLAQHG